MDFLFQIQVACLTHMSCIKSPVTPTWRRHSVPTSSKEVADRRGARCAVASNFVCALCLNIQSNAAAII